MTINAETIQQLIMQGIPDSTAHIEDLRGDGDTHFKVGVTSASFAGRSLVDQHRMVYAALKNHIDPDRHVLSLKTSVAK